MQRTFFLSFLLVLGLFSCSVSKTQTNTDLLEFTILQINDVYEIAPIEGGLAGGVARVAQVKKELLAENPNTISVIAGDFLSPSLIANLKLENNEKVAGLQMIEALNAMGLNYATFGNHEFDISDVELLQKRLNQCNFQYACCNVVRADGGKKRPFSQMVDGQEVPVPPYIIHEFKSPGGRSVKVAIIGVVLPFNKKDYLEYTDVTSSFRAAYKQAKKEADLVLGLTHQSMDEDIQLAQDVPGIPLFMGGHEHVHLNHYIEETIITKADANAKTAYIHRFTFDPASGLVNIRSTLKAINENIESEPTTQKVVDKWKEKVNTILTEQGFEPEKVVMTTKEKLHCTEAMIRNQQTNYGQLAAAAVQMAFPNAEVCLMNSGSMRLDDDIDGTIKEYDVLRTFPFGGPMVSMEVPGKDLMRILNIGLIENKGEGGYLQVLNIGGKKDAWTINGQQVDANKKYSVAVPEFVAKGQEANLEIFKNFAFEAPDDLNMGNQSVPNDIRQMVIAYMETLN